jgi:hypothetical protein
VPLDYPQGERREERGERREERGERREERERERETRWQQRKNMDLGSLQLLRGTKRNLWKKIISV